MSIPSRKKWIRWFKNNRKFFKTLKMKTYIIAEVGPNHNGSLSLATKYIDLISKSGANAVKFQLAQPSEVYSRIHLKQISKK